MQFIYLDPGLINDVGHHANSCRHITGELRKRQITPAVFAFERIEAGIRQELQARPFFHWYTYWDRLDDPLCGWLQAFERGWRQTRLDLERIKGLKPADMVYVNSVRPTQFMAVVQWLKEKPPAQRPHVILEFGTETGLVDGIAPDPRVDARAMLYRYAASQLVAGDLARLKLATFDAGAAAAFHQLIGQPVGVLPVPHVAVTARRDRAKSRPITVAVLGHQRPDKGYHLVPGIVRMLLQSRNDVRFLIHNGGSGDMPEAQAELRALAADRRIELVEKPAGPPLWRDLLERSDLIVCPYDRNRFIDSYSAVAAEALANAIPLVVPDGTTLSALVADFGGPGTVFAEQSDTAVAAAIGQAIDRFDSLAGLARAAAERWEETRGAAKLVSTMLSWR